MKYSRKLSFFLMWAVSISVRAEVVTDGTLGSVQNLSDQMIIPQTLGKTVGNNLFHSFQTFNINTGESATFTGGDTLKNVISRVTGGQVSTIDGLLKSEIPTANFYFINPAGVTFGANAQVDVPAAFHISTGNVLNFQDDSTLAVDTPASSLTVAPPSSFGFVGSLYDENEMYIPREITINGSVLNFNHDVLIHSSSGIVIDNGTLSNTSGAITLQASLQEYLFLINKTSVSTHTSSASNAGNISISASSVKLNDSSIQSYTDSTGSAGKITLQSGEYGEVSFSNNSVVSTHTNSVGNAGDIVISSGSTWITNSTIQSNTYSTGAAGAIALQISSHFNMLDHGTINTRINSANNGGSITVTSPRIYVNDGTAIESKSNTSADAGKIILHSDNIENKGIISSDSSVPYTAQAQIMTDGSLGEGDFKDKENALVSTSTGYFYTSSYDDNSDENLVKQFAFPPFIVTQAMGTSLGDNLFHSFKVFNLNEGETVTFTGADNLKNLISRVTGGDVSRINGKLTSAVGSANFYFINPAGVIFGSAAQLDVPASFHVSTANTLRFADENQFSASYPATSSLSMTEPASFGFFANSAADNIGTITINDTGLNTIELNVLAGKTLDVVARNIEINNAELTADEGGVRLLAIQGAGEVSLHHIVDGGFDLPTLEPSLTNAGNINTDSARIVTWGDGGGHAQLWGNNISLKNSFIFNDNNGDKDVSALKKFDIHAQLFSMNAGLISSNALGNGHGGALNLTAKTVDIRGGASVVSENRGGAGNAGNITINADFLTLDGENIETEEISRISSDTLGAGNSGTVTLNVKMLNVLNQAKISSQSVYSDTSGNAGNLYINASEKINLSNQATISTSTVNAGNSGNVTVTAPIILLDNSSISAAAVEGSSGQTGGVTVIASKSLQLANQSKISVKNDATTTSDSETINAGLIKITAPDIDLKNSTITAESTGNINASHIEVNFSHALTMDPSFITTSANLGNGGSIFINSDNGLINLQNSGFFTSVTGATGNGGNINVSANTLIMDNGAVQANAVTGSGGDINLNLKALIPTQNQLIKGGVQVQWQPFISGFNVIQAASASGINGAVNISSPQFNISGSISGLDSAALVMPIINQAVCQGSILPASSLVNRGKGGIPDDGLKFSFVPAMEMQNVLQQAQDILTIYGMNEKQKIQPCRAL